MPAKVYSLNITNPQSGSQVFNIYIQDDDEQKKYLSETDVFNAFRDLVYELKLFNHMQNPNSEYQTFKNYTKENVESFTDNLRSSKQAYWSTNLAAASFATGGIAYKTILNWISMISGIGGTAIATTSQPNYIEATKTVWKEL